MGALTKTKRQTNENTHLHSHAALEVEALLTDGEEALLADKVYGGGGVRHNLVELVGGGQEEARAEDQRRAIQAHLDKPPKGRAS